MSRRRGARQNPKTIADIRRGIRLREKLNYREFPLRALNRRQQAILIKEEMTAKIRTAQQAKVRAKCLKEREISQVRALAESLAERSMGQVRQKSRKSLSLTQFDGSSETAGSSVDAWGHAFALQYNGGNLGLHIDFAKDGPNRGTNYVMVVVGVDSGSMAEHEGVQVGDIVVAVGGNTSCSSQEDISSLLASSSLPVCISLWRQGSGDKKTESFPSTVVQSREVSSERRSKKQKERQARSNGRNRSKVIAGCHAARARDRRDRVNVKQAHLLEGLLEDGLLLRDADGNIRSESIPNGRVRSWHEIYGIDKHEAAIFTMGKLDAQMKRDYTEMKRSPSPEFKSVKDKQLRRFLNKVHSGGRKAVDEVMEDMRGQSHSKLVVNYTTPRSQYANWFGMNDFSLFDVERSNLSQDNFPADQFERGRRVKSNF
jgi:hypothetical protein